MRARVVWYHEAMTNAADITQQLLAFSRTSKDKVTVFDFNTIIHEVAQLTGRSLRSNIKMKLVPKLRTGVAALERQPSQRT